MSNNNTQSQIVSELAFLDIKENVSPSDLVTDWLEEAKEHGIKLPFMNLATSSKSGDVTNRSVLLQEYRNNKFMFITDDRSKKAVQIDENPKAAACLVLQYFKDGKYVTRQIRIEGIAHNEETEKYWKTEPLFAQIRTLIAKQLGEIDWDEKSRRNQELLKEAQTGINFKMPENHVSYEITPDMLNFYHGVDMLIADKVEFRKDIDNKWTFERVV